MPITFIHHLKALADPECDFEKQREERKHGRNKKVKGGRHFGMERGFGALLAYSFWSIREPLWIGTYSVPFCLMVCWTRQVQTRHCAHLEWFKSQGLQKALSCLCETYPYWARQGSCEKANSLPECIQDNWQHLGTLPVRTGLWWNECVFWIKKNDVKQGNEILKAGFTALHW